MKHSVLGSILILLFSAVGCTDSDQQDQLPEEVSKQAQQRIDDDFHLGTIIGVVDANGRRFYGFGQVSLDNQQEPDEHTIFEIGSVTKTFTSTLIAELSMRSELGMADVIWTDLPKPDSIPSANSEQITIESLITHTSGFPRDPSNSDLDDNNRYQSYSEGDVKQYLTSYSFDTLPGQHSYSNFGYLLLEHLVENKMDASYESLVASEILNPLGMEDTYFTVPETVVGRLAIGFREGRPTRTVDIGQWNAIGGLKSTADDMLTFLSAQLGFDTKSKLRAIKMTHEERFSDGENVEALGWHILNREESGRRIHFHRGGTDGFVSFAGFDVENQVGVVVLVNGTRWFSDLGFHLLDPTYPLADPSKTN
ncbi:beta-lactamase family protein [bacterium]|nr:beta-lactamase family protein [bacterium]